MPHTPYPERFADHRQARLRERRRRVGLLAIVLAGMADISQPEYSMIETGRRCATPAQIAALDLILRRYERAQASILRAACARSLVSTSA